MVDVSQHELVPEHVVLDEDAVQDVLDEYNIDRTDLPKIKYQPGRSRHQDPALRDLDEDIQPGDVIKIVRDSRTTDEAIVYRLVVK